MQRTLELKRASDALIKVQSIQDDQRYSVDWKDKYASYAESLPATILNCGLGQAAAALLAASNKNDGKAANDSHYILYKDLEKWLCRNETEAPYKAAGNLMQAIVENDQRAYLHAQAEALMWLEWLKKLAVAYLKKPKAGE